MDAPEASAVAPRPDQRLVWCWARGETGRQARNAAVSLTSSTLLTLLVIPAIYVVLRDDGQPLPDQPKAFHAT